MFFNVFAVVRDAARRYDGIPHQLKTYLSTQVVWDISFLMQNRKITHIQTIEELSSKTR